MSNRKLVNLPLAVPPVLKEWVDGEAARFGLSRNAYLTMQLLLLQKTDHIERLRRLETRVASLEHKVCSGL